LNKVIEAEKQLFGATDAGSAIALRVSQPSQEAKEFTEQTSTRIGGTWQATGKGYLLWSMARSGNPNRGNVKPARWYFPVGTHFQVTLVSRNSNEAQFQQAIASFWLLTQLGSVGSRSRRCAGSLAVQTVNQEVSALPFSQPKDTLTLRSQLEQGLQIARSLYSNEQQVSRLHPTTFDALAHGACRIWVLQDEQPWASAEMAMTKLGERLQDYRSHISIEQRRIFGLPLPPKFFKERRASPLMLRVTELQGNKYVGIAVLFKTGGRNIRMEDYTVIERWINEFRGKLEVTL
jgi:CRISPR-associated protein Cmr1